VLIRKSGGSLRGSKAFFAGVRDLFFWFVLREQISFAESPRLSHADKIFIS